MTSDGMEITKWPSLWGDINDVKWAHLPWVRWENLEPRGLGSLGVEGRTQEKSNTETEPKELIRGPDEYLGVCQPMSCVSGVCEAGKQWLWEGSRQMQGNHEQDSDSRAPVSTSRGQKTGTQAVRANVYGIWLEDTQFSPTGAMWLCLSSSKNSKWLLPHIFIQWVCCWTSGCLPIWEWEKIST